MASGHVISDLHLFAHRSVAGSYARDIERAAARSDFFVLNGDIFDFRWSTLPTIENSLDAAVAWLRRLVSANPRCHFHYTLGNHDCYEPFIDRLDALAREVPNLDWHPTHVRLGPILFLHGDLPLSRRRADVAARTTHRVLGRNGRTLRLMYRLFVAARGPRVVASLHPPRACARRIVRWLNTNGDGAAAGVTDVYFGHTHRAFTDFRHRGLSFHNTGSAIRGLKSRMLEVQTPTAPAPVSEPAG